MPHHGGAVQAEPRSSGEVSEVVQDTAEGLDDRHRLEGGGIAIIPLARDFHQKVERSAARYSARLVTVEP